MPYSNYRAELLRGRRNIGVKLMSNKSRFLSSDTFLFGRFFLNILFCFSLLIVAGCSKDMERGRSTLAAGTAGGPVVPGTNRDFQVNVGNIVYFTTDSSELTPDARRTLAGQVKWLRQYPRFSVTLEGHADERGTREYNIALGARRADAVRRYFISQGVRPTRLRTISYGKERPVALCDDISCWSQNRRVVTILNRRAGS